MLLAKFVILTRDTEAFPIPTQFGSSQGHSVLSNLFNPVALPFVPSAYAYNPNTLQAQPNMPSINPSAAPINQPAYSYNPRAPPVNRMTQYSQLAGSAFNPQQLPTGQVPRQPVPPCGTYHRGGLGVQKPSNRNAPSSLSASLLSDPNRDSLLLGAAARTPNVNDERQPKAKVAASPSANFVDNTINIPKLVKQTASGRESILQMYLTGKLAYNHRRTKGLRVSMVPESGNLPPFSVKLGRASYVIKIVWKKHQTEDYDRNYLIITEDWELYISADKWSFELLNLITFERLIFIGRDFEVRRLDPCVTCKEHGSKCADGIPCKTCIKKGRASCRPTARLVSVSEYSNLGLNASSIVLIGDDLLPFNTNGVLNEQEHVARAIRQHTIKTNDPNTAIVLASLPTPRDKRFVDEGNELFEKFTNELVKGLKDNPDL